MELVDTVTCVVCGKREHQRSTGKSSRTFAGVCRGCRLEGDDATQTSIPGSEPKGISARK